MKLQINKLENVGLKCCNDHKAVIQYSNDISIRIFDWYNPGKKCKLLIVFDHLTADKISNKKLNSQKSLNYLLKVEN